MTRVGIVGFGHLGQYLYEAIKNREGLQLAFVWNRSREVLLGKVEEQYVLTDLEDFHKFNADLIVEVAHPSITREYGESFLRHADYLIGSPTALADSDVETRLRQAATVHGIYIPGGAFWGGEDIAKMVERNTLQALSVSMTKHPDCFKLQGELVARNELAKKLNEKTILYDGPVRGLCPLAPNNVNTMAAASMIANNLGFDGVKGILIADPHLGDWHVVTVEVWGPGDISKGEAFHVVTQRNNPAKVGNVTGSATYNSFLSSLLRAHGKGPGVHLC